MVQPTCTLALLFYKLQLLGKAFDTRRYTRKIAQ